MGVFEKLKKLGGGYIFLSHSHDDIEKVRKIRNELEKEGFEPLCFYLKCLNDDDEIEDLIKREIDAREWFVFVDSENARNSRWVNLEREYIKRTDSKKIITVDLADADSIREATHKITHNLRIFFSHSHKDYPLAKRITDRLKKKDYLVYFDVDDLSPNDYTASIKHAITEAAQEGCVLLLLTENAVYSSSLWLEREVAYALSIGGNFLPIYVGDVQLNSRWRSLLGNIEGFSLPGDPSDEDIDRMIHQMGRFLLNRRPTYV